MLPDDVKARLRKLCENATPGPRALLPRNINWREAIAQGTDPVDVAAANDDWCLGWEIVAGAGFAHVSRGDFRGSDAALIMATPPEVILALLDEIDKLKESQSA
jgi:hypothetical protein